MLRSFCTFYVFSFHLFMFCFHLYVFSFHLFMSSVFTFMCSVFTFSCFQFSPFHVLHHLRADRFPLSVWLTGCTCLVWSCTSLLFEVSTQSAFSLYFSDTMKYVRYRSNLVHWKEQCGSLQNSLRRGEEPRIRPSFLLRSRASTPPREITQLLRAWYGNTLHYISAKRALEN